MWHGWADQLIAAGGSIDYMKRVQQQNGGPAKTGQFARLFMASGVGHCGGGPGAAPSGQFDAVVKWVEQGIAPETLQGVKRDQDGTVRMSRPLCQYPLGARYKGRGSENDAGSFECRADR
jgi:feruloyl esterase